MPRKSCIKTYYIDFFLQAVWTRGRRRSEALIPSRGSDGSAWLGEASFCHGGMYPLPTLQGLANDAEPNGHSLPLPRTSEQLMTKWHLYPEPCFIDDACAK